MQAAYVDLDRAPKQTRAAGGRQRRRPGNTGTGLGLGQAVAHRPVMSGHARAAGSFASMHGASSQQSINSTKRRRSSVGFADVVQHAIKGKISLLTEENHRGKAINTELYFDLIFVAALYRLGSMYADDYLSDNRNSAIDTAIGFGVLWLTWHHVNMLYTRFALEDVWNVAEYFIMVLALVLAITMVNYADVDTCTDSVYGSATPNATHAAASTTGYRLARAAAPLAPASTGNSTSCTTATWSVPGIATVPFKVAWGVSRLQYLVIYVAGVVYNKQARRMIFWYILNLALAVVLIAATIAIDDRAAFIGVAILVLMVELAMYSSAIVFTKPSDRLPIDVHHNIERAELWAILVLGESMMSLVHGAGSYYRYGDADFFVNTVVAFSINFILLKLYSASQPDPAQHNGDAGLDTHALDLSLFHSIFFDMSQAVVTAMLFVYGVACKFVVKYGHYKDGSKYSRDHAYLFSLGTGLSLLFIALSRHTHEWSDYTIWGPVTRRRLWNVHILMAVVIMTLPLYTIDSSYDASKGKYKRTGLTVMEYMFCVLACALTSLLCDFVSTFPPEEVLEELAEFNDATKQLQQGEVPDDVNKDDIDVAMLTAATTTALGTGRMRNLGTKQMRFTDKSMLNARQARRVMKWKRADSPEKEDRAGTPIASLFSLYQKNVDERDPNHAMSSKNTRKRWRLGQNAASITGHLRKSSMKASIKRKVAPAPFTPSTSTTAEDNV